MQSFQQTPMRPASQHASFDPYSHFNALPDFTLEAMTTVPGWTAAPMSQGQYSQVPHMQGQYNPQQQQQQNPFANPVFDPNAAAYPFPAYDPQQQQQGMPGIGGGGDMFGFGGQMQGQQQGNWDMDSGNFGVGLNHAEQEELMRELESDGMEDIQGIIQTTLESITPKAPQGPTFR